jgi:peptidoglycan/xylan/chitin deacetylase (PgdA/CDA1 family)
MESIYEYGARAGLLAPASCSRTRDAGHRLRRRHRARPLARTGRGDEGCGWEIASHGLKWIDYRDIQPEEERARSRGDPPPRRGHRRAPARLVHRALLGEHRRSRTEEGGFAYIADSYADDLPYWRPRRPAPADHALHARFERHALCHPQGFNAGDQFFRYLKDSFDVLYAEGQAGAPKMLSIGLHCRLVGRPGRARRSRRFLDHIRAHERRLVRHGASRSPGTGPNATPREEPRAPLRDGPRRLRRPSSAASSSTALDRRARPRAGLGPAHDTATGLQNALARAFRSASDGERLGVLNAHPDLAGKLAAGKAAHPRVHRRAGLGRASMR